MLSESWERRAPLEAVLVAILRERVEQEGDIHERTMVSVLSNRAMVLHALDQNVAAFEDLEMAIDHTRMDVARAEETLNVEQNRLDQDSKMGLRELDMRREALAVEYDSRRADLETTFHAQMTEMQVQLDHQSRARLRMAEEQARAEGDFTAARSMLELGLKREFQNSGYTRHLITVQFI